MGMGMCPVATWKIEADAVRDLCPRQYKALMVALKESELTVDELADNLARENDVPEDVMKAYRRLCEAFYKVTKKGKSTLELCLSYHGDEDGDRYDDVRGAFWEVGGVETFTPAAKAIQVALQRVQYVVFG